SYKVLVHTSDEQPRVGVNAFQDYVLAVAQGKMRSLRLPEPTKTDSDYIFALTADTLERSPSTSQIFGKPMNKDHAVKMLKTLRQGPVEVVTACCLDKFYRRNDGWQRGEHEQWLVSSMVEFYVDDASIESYLAAMPMALQASGAAMVEDNGLRFLKSIQGSYSAVIGLPLYELCHNLRKLGFKL
ncbi:Maf-like protein, partial [bacterium]|nr:Maf-like protein [bacterium]